MFKRASLSGSADFFEDTSTAPEILAETDPEPPAAAIHQLPLPREYREPAQRDYRDPLAHDGREPTLRDLRDSYMRNTQASLPGEMHNGVTYYEYRLSEPQVRALIEAVQKLKYPHTVKSGARLSMEEFERMEALRQILLDGLR